MDTRDTVSMSLLVRMQEIADFLNEALEEVDGESVPFLLLLKTGRAAQYLCNCSSKDAHGLIESLLDSWKAGRADIPAHIDPAFPKS